MKMNSFGMFTLAFQIVPSERETENGQRERGSSERERERESTIGESG